MRKRWVWLLVAACFLVVLGMAGMGLSAVPRPIAPPQRLPDGSTLIPLGVTGGTTHHRWTDGGPLQAALSRLWPVGVPFPPGLNVYDYNTTAADVPVLWLRRTKSAGGGTPYYIQRITTQDSDGCVMQQGSTGETFMDGSGVTYLHAVPITQFNRRDSQIHLQFVSYSPQGALRRDAEITLPNPLPASLGSLTAAPLPASAADGPVTFTLDRLLTRANNSTPPHLSTNPLEQWTQLAMHATVSGKRVSNWTVADVEARDGTGNVVSSTSSTSGVDAGEVHYSWQGALCPQEPAWTLRLEMSRQSGFARNELWTLQNIRVPAAKERLPMGQKRALQGVTVEAGDVAGPNAPLKNGATQMSGATGLQFKALGWRNGLRMTLVSVTDQLGRQVRTTGSSYGNGEHAFGIQPAAGAKTLSVTLAVHPSRYVEFTARPTLPPPADPAQSRR